MYVHVSVCERGRVREKVKERWREIAKVRSERTRITGKENPKEPDSKRGSKREKERERRNR